MRILEKFPPPKDLYKYMLELDQKVENEEQTKKRWHRDFGTAFAQGMHWEPAPHVLKGVHTDSYRIQNIKTHPHGMRRWCKMQMRWAKDAFYEKGAYGLPRADRIQTPFLRIPEPSFPDSKRFVSDYQHASAYWHNPPPTMPPPTMPPAEPAVHTSTLPDMRCSTLPRRCTPPSPAWASPGHLNVAKGDRQQWLRRYHASHLDTRGNLRTSTSFSNDRLPRRVFGSPRFSSEA